VQTERFPVSDTALAADVLRQALQKPYLMDYRFQSVELLADTPATIVPLEHFNKSDMLAFYRLCFPAKSEESRARSNTQLSTLNSQPSSADMQYQILSSVEAAMIFRLDQDVLRIVQECYPDVKVCCSEAEQLEHFAAMQERRPAPADSQQRDAYVRFGEKQFYVAVFSRSTLQYAASQAADNDNDRTFLLLGIWKALDMNATRDTCHLEGASKELQKTLAEYILNLSEE